MSEKNSYNEIIEKIIQFKGIEIQFKRTKNSLNEHKKMF